MLIHDEVQRLCTEGRLYVVHSREWRAPTKRRVYVSRDVHAFIESLSAEDKTDRSSLQALFSRFISGDTISVAFSRQIKASDIKRLSPGSAEVWEFKARKGHQFRVFGRIAWTDTMIVLTGPVDRKGINYAAETQRCQETWRELFGNIPPLHGIKLSDYISGTNVVSL